MDHDANMAMLSAVMRTERKVEVLGRAIFNGLSFVMFGVFYLMVRDQIGSGTAFILGFILSRIISYFWERQFSANVLPSVTEQALFGKATLK